jgi:glycyl-tRNA synthetase alpha subunit
LQPVLASEYGLQNFHHAILLTKWLHRKIAQELNDVRVLLQASEDRLKAAESKNENEAKIALQMEEMKSTIERMRTQAQDAAEKRALPPKLNYLALSKKCESLDIFL